MDEKHLEIAARLELMDREAAIRRATQRAKPPAGFDGVNCTDCEDPIPDGRLALGAWRCITCQTMFEKARR